MVPIEATEVVVNYVLVCMGNFNFTAVLIDVLVVMMEVKTHTA